MKWYEFYRKREKAIINPYYLFFSVHLLVFFLYSLKWSELYPNLSIETILFFVLILCIALIYGFLFQFKKVVTYKKLNNNKIETFIRKSFIFLFVSYLLDFIICGYIPLISLFDNSGNSYGDFGIPFFHVLIVTYNGFFATFYFYYLISQEKIKLSKCIIFILLLFPFILLVLRGTLIMILINCVQLYVLKVLSKRSFLKTATLFFSVSALGIATSYLFGLFGNIRNNSLYNYVGTLNDSTLFLKIGQASEEFKNSIIPDWFFWVYSYITSPIANFQNTVLIDDNRNISFDNIVNFINYEFFPDFLSSRIENILNLKNDAAANLITPELSVSTGYIGSFYNLSWLGVILFIAFLFSFSAFYILFLKKNSPDFFLTGVVTLNTICMLILFTNTWTFSGLSFQLIFPIMFIVFNKIRLFNKGDI